MKLNTVSRLSLQGDFILSVFVFQRPSVTPASLHPDLPPQPNTVPLPPCSGSQIKSKWWIENYLEIFFPWWDDHPPRGIVNLENELCTAERRRSFWFRGHLPVTPDGCPVHYQGQPRGFHISLLWGGSQEADTQAESISVVTKLCRGKLWHLSECLPLGPNLFIPPQVDEQLLEFLPLSPYLISVYKYTLLFFSVYLQVTLERCHF